MDIYNYSLGKGHVKAVESIFGFTWIICPKREEEVEVGMFERRDDIHILPMFWFQTVRESKGVDEVCEGAICDDFTPHFGNFIQLQVYCGSRKSNPLTGSYIFFE